MKKKQKTNTQSKSKKRDRTKNPIKGTKITMHLSPETLQKMHTVIGIANADPNQNFTEVSFAKHCVISRTEQYITEIREELKKQQLLQQAAEEAQKQNSQSNEGEIPADESESTIEQAGSVESAGDLSADEFQSVQGPTSEKDTPVPHPGTES